MKINKFILEDVLTLSSISSLIFGTPTLSLGIIVRGILEIQKLLNYQPLISEKIAVFCIATGATGFGFGLLLMQVSILIGESIGKDPTPDVPFPCKGCRNYHGVVYNGTTFICAMHPYGSQSQTCSDYERSQMSSRIRRPNKKL
ncbi:MAG: hypothetical protein DSM106950_07760 [Stigonema ocellatum SAG 48.90 = DSM 106950]|nr:hypothetical protein [Stigonema ocellatum SAG 48.90 = DSM 106950]